MSQMKLGWWRARDGGEHKIDVHAKHTEWPWRSSCGGTWKEGGLYNVLDGDSIHDLIEFLRPLEDLPPALNSAVKAAEDMVRRLESQYHAAQRLANEACENLNHARLELERLEKECEVDVTNAAQVGDHGQGFMPAIKECEVKP